MKIKKHVKLVSLTLGIIMILLPLASCSSSYKSSKAESATVMTIGSYQVPYEVYRYFVLNHRRDITQNESHTDSELESMITSYTMQSLRELYAPLALCQQYNIDPFSDVMNTEVDNAVKSAKAKYSTEDEFYSALSADFSNESVFRLLERVSLCRDKLYSAVETASPYYGDNDALAAYFASDSVIRVKQILIKSDNGKTDDENLATIESVNEELSSGADFDELLNEYGEDLTLFSNNDGYYVIHGAMNADFESASFALSIGEVSGIVKTSSGYTIIKRYEKDTSYLTEHFDDLCDNYYYAQYNLAAEDMAASLSIVTNSLYDSYPALSVSMETK